MLRKHRVSTVPSNPQTFSDVRDNEVLISNIDYSIYPCAERWLSLGHSFSAAAFQSTLLSFGEVKSISLVFSVYNLKVMKGNGGGL